MKTPKRPCYYSNHSISSNPNNLIESFISNTDPASLTTSFNQILESQSKKNDFIQRAIDISSALLEAANRSRCERASAHNAFVWPFPYDVTVKVFSMIDTQSVCNAAATCSFFNKCAMDPLCYADIDLVTLVPKVNDAAVSTMIQRAGNALQSIKLGIMPEDEDLWPGDAIDSILTSSCLSSLKGNGGALCLRRLHLYNIEGMDNAALLASLAVCPSLIDLEIVCLHVKWKLILESVSKHIPLIERLICESFWEDDHHGLEYSTCSKFVLNCPNITTLALKGFKMPNSLARKLVKGFRKLKYVDFSNTYDLSGSFLKNLGTNGGGENLEVMILRDTFDLKQDISHRDGLASNHDYYESDRLYSTSFIPIKQLLQQRPNFCLLAEFGESHSECEVIDGGLSSQSGSDTYTSTSDSSYISDQDSGSDDSSDDVDHYPV